MTGLRFVLAAGILLVSLLTAAMFVLVAGPMASDLAARVDQQLVDAGQSWASVAVDGQTAILSGTAPTLEAQRRAVAAATGVWGIRRVVDASAILPLQPSYVFTLVRSAEGLALTGYLPSADVRLALKTEMTALFPGLAVTDRTTLARGQPVDFVGLAQFAIARTAELAEGTATLAGPSLSIDGTARDEASFAAAATALTHGLPANIELRTVRILPPRAASFTWSMNFDGRTAAITGFVPSELVRGAIRSALTAAAPGIGIDDQTRLASGAPEGFGSAAAFAAAQLPRLAEGTARIEGTVLTLSGKAKSVADHQAMLADLGMRRDQAGDGVTIGAVDVEPPFVDPYVWRATREADRVILSGYVPTEAAQQQVAAEAARQFPAVRIEDRLAIAAGDPKMDWIGALRFSLGQLALLDKGAVSLTGRDYGIEGEAASVADFKTLSDQLKRTLPASMTLVQDAVAPAVVSPFVFGIVRTERGLTLSGYVPTDEMASEILAAAKPRFRGGEVELNLERASGAPDGLQAVAVAAVQAVSRLAAGHAALSDQQLTLAGAAVSEDARQAIEADLKAALPEGYALSSAVIVAVGGDPLSATECQQALDAELSGQQIVFDDDGASIQPQSFGLVDRLSAIVQRCPAARVEIGGHTDSAGGAKRNKAISEDEAGAVLERLVANGVRRERLTTVGYGESQPIASNATAEGRDRNSRIAFTVENR
ncbi:OmpA family protein [Mesorhizobium sp. BR1-1-16]|uniref:OmpA family protein n=1 Tax=Mesorhizobium sp. BR1-1-16 TaxID=2876653 RepID=UPI001CC97B95|nr:OmpA family protein [Mesorhizobium sp. BR1-1-16]MBZ9935417.1 OmpA family protein [Mesorhizobium sp. BR1-1-16]